MNFLNLDNSFNKKERLSKKTEIDVLFLEGKSFIEKFILIYYKKCLYDKNTPVKVMISVSKKKHAKAVDRNLIKRRLREPNVPNSSNTGLCLAF